MTGEEFRTAAAIMLAVASGVAVLVVGLLLLYIAPRMSAPDLDRSDR